MPIVMVWKGWGAPVAAGIAGLFIVPAVLVDGGDGSWTTGAFIASGILVAAFGQWLHRTQDEKHSLMGIPVRWVGLVLLVLGLMFLLGGTQTATS